MRSVLLCLLVGFVGACAETPAPVEAPRERAVGSVGMERGNDDEEAEAAADEVVSQPATLEEVGTAPLLPPPQHRTRHRMNLDQLQRSLSRVMGGLEWTQGGDSVWAKRASMLGVPNYMSSVRENLTPNLLFEKTLGDAARDLCPQLLAQEATALPEERVFLLNVGPEDTLETNEAGMLTTLRRLILLYHGRHIPEEDPAFTPWLSLLTNLMNQAETPADAWTAVCVALITHPEFQSY